MIGNARLLRKEMTTAEQLFWKHFRNRKFSNLKIRRQQRIIWAAGATGNDYFIADFYCAQYKLVIEIDGGIHEEQVGRDKWREDILKEQGYHILRFKNEELQDMESVKLKITECIKQIKR